MFALFFIFISTTLAQRKVSALSPVEEAQFSYQQFNACKDLAKEKHSINREQLLECVSSQTSSNVTERLNQKIAIWLVSLKSLGALQECPADKLILFPRASSKEYKILRCASFIKGGDPGKALFYFKEEAGQMKIDGIQFL